MEENVRSEEMARAFLLINVAAGKEDAVMNKLLKLKGIREVHIIPGEYDLIAVLEVERGWIRPTSERLRELVKDKVRKIAGISRTETLIPLLSKFRK